MHAKNLADVNLALHKPTVASSGSAGTLATDGDMSTRWESQWKNDDETLTVDLQGIYKVNKVKVDWENAAASSYDIQTSTDGHTWKTSATATATGGGWVTTALDNVNTRFLRLQGKGRLLEAYGYSLFELEVYGSQKVSDATSLLVYEGTDAKGVAQLSGTYDAKGFTAIEDEHAATAYDFTQVALDEGTSFDTENPNALILVCDEALTADLMTNSQNVAVLKDGVYRTKNLVYTDESGRQTINTALPLKAVYVQYTRTSDGTWQTLAVPFEPTAVEGTLRAYTLNSYDADRHVADFVDASSVKANQPYLVSLGAKGDTVTLSAQNADVLFSEGSASKGALTFHANYQWVSPVGAARNWYLLGTENSTSLFSLNANGDLSQLRAYMLLCPTVDAPVSLTFNGSTDGIETISSQEGRHDGVYTLSGQRVNADTTLPPGIYIKNGKKMVSPR